MRAEYETAVEGRQGGKHDFLKQLRGTQTHWQITGQEADSKAGGTLRNHAGMSSTVVGKGQNPYVLH